MRSLLLAALIALAVPITANADTVADRGRIHVYLGHIDDAGRFAAPTFDHVPAIKSSLEATTDVRLSVPVTITAREGVRLRNAASPHADTVGRLASGARVRLLAVHNSFGYVWGEIDTGGAKVLAMRPRAYAIDGFAGRSGAAPSPATSLADGINRPNVCALPRLGVRLTC